MTKTYSDPTRVAQTIVLISAQANGGLLKCYRAPLLLGYRVAFDKFRKLSKGTIDEDLLISLDKIARRAIATGARVLAGRGRRSAIWC